MSSETDIAWAAGLFEGEGCFSYHIQNKNTGRIQVQAIMTQADKDVLDRFHQIIGCGYIRSKKPRKEHNKPLFVWQVTSVGDFKRVGLLLWTQLSERRKARFMEILDILDSKTFDGRTTRHLPQGHPVHAAT